MAVRRQLIEPAESTIALVERIAAQQYDAATADHCIKQLRQIVGELNAWFDGDARMIARLRAGLEKFERRLISMSRSAE